VPEAAPEFEEIVAAGAARPANKGRPRLQKNLRNPLMRLAVTEQLSERQGKYSLASASEVEAGG
jgi:hypothetical protein